MCLQYRSLKNFRNPEFLGPRLGDKLVFSFIISTLYWQIGECSRPLAHSSLEASRGLDCCPGGQATAGKCSLAVNLFVVLMVLI